MPKISNRLSFPLLPRSKQISNFCCGPATLEMLLAFVGVNVSQVQIIRSVGMVNKIRERGVTIEELAQASKKLAPQLQFWFKCNSTIEELISLINEFKQPVGVEWQGIFEKEEEDGEGSDEDPGHYSVVTGVNLKKNTLTLADPYKLYAGKDRELTLLEFKRRWWDINEVINPKTGRPHQVDDYHAMFTVVPQIATFPQKLEMQKG